MFYNMIKPKHNKDGTVTLHFSDTKKTVTLEVAHLTAVDKIARIRAQILEEGYFFGERIEKRLNKMFGN